jgi:hypothetical protein
MMGFGVSGSEVTPLPTRGPHVRPRIGFRLCPDDRIRTYFGCPSTLPVTVTCPPTNSGMLRFCAAAPEAVTSYPDQNFRPKQ